MQSYDRIRVCPCCRLDEAHADFTPKGKRCRSCEKAYHAAWYAANKDGVKKRVARWKKENPDKTREYNRATRAKKPMEYAERSRAWRDGNKDLMAKLKRDWRKANPEKDAEYNHKRRARGGNASAENIKLIFKRDGYRCLKCNSKERISIDHIQPISRGGSNDFNNLHTLCMACNLAKHTKTIDYRK